MDKKLIAEVVSDLAELPHPSAESSDDQTNADDLPFYIIPPPPIPGKTTWSIAPW